MIEAFARRSNQVRDSVFPAQTLPSTFNDIVGSGWDNAMFSLRFDSNLIAERQAVEDMLGDLVKQKSADDPDFSPDQLRTSAQKHYAGFAESPAFDGRPVSTFHEAQYAAALELMGDHYDVPSWAEIQQRAAEKAGTTRQAFEHDMMFTMSTHPRVAAFIGGGGASMLDPVNLTALIGSTPLLVTRSVMAGAMLEGAIGAATESLIQLKVAPWQQKVGHDYSTGDAAAAILASTLFSAGIGGGVSFLYRSFGGTNTGILTPKRIPTGKPATPDRDTPPATPDRDTPPPDPLRSSTEWDFAFSLDENGLDTEWGSNAWSARRPLNRAIEMAYSLPDSEQSILATAAIQDQYLRSTNPWWHSGVWEADGATIKVTDLGPTRDFNASLTPEFAYDTVIYNANRLELDRAHSHMLEQAISALNRGEALSLEQKTALSIELKVGDSPEHVFHVEHLRQQGIALDLKNPKYKEFLNGLITKYIGESLSRLAKNAPDDVTTPLKMTLRKPRTTPETVVRAGGKLHADIEAKKARVEEHKAKQAEYMAQRDALPKTDETLAVRVELKRKANALNPVIKKAEFNIAEARKKLTKDMPAKLNAAAKAQAAYDKQLRELTALRDSINAAADLKALQEGRIPPRLIPLRNRLDKELRQAAETVKLPPELEETLDAFLQLNPFVRRGSKLHRQLTDLLSEEEKKLLYQPTPPAQVTASNMAAMNRLDGSMEFYADGQRITVKQQLDEFDALDEELNGILACSIGGGTGK